MKALIEILNSYLDTSDIYSTQELNNVDDENSFGNHIDTFDDSFDIEKLNQYNIAIIGVGEDRNSKKSSGLRGVNIIRGYLYDLFVVKQSINVLELGNMKLGRSVNDTYFALKDLVKELVNNSIVPVIIGGSHDLTYPQYMAYEKMDSQFNLTTIDSRINIGKVDSSLSATTYLSKIVLENGSHLFNYTNLGYQKYLVPFQEVDMMSKLYFETLRVGEIQENISLCEPILRDSDIVSFDMSAIRMSDSPGSDCSSPNGLFGNEACQIGYYSGISDKVSSFGLFEYNPELDVNGQSGKLAAQIIWHFIDGFYNRVDDILNENKDDLRKFTVEVTVSDHKIVFLHSPKTNRWWIVVPVRGAKSDKNRVVACSSDDYKLATNGEIPDKWWKTYRLMN